MAISPTAEPQATKRGWRYPFDPNHRVVDQLRYQRRMPRQHTDLAGGGAGEHESALPGPDLAFDGDDIDVHVNSHATPPPADE